MTLATAARPSARLSAELKDSTAQAHERAEHSNFMGQLLAGELDADAYAALHGQMWFVYSALERAARAVAGDPIAANIIDPRLERVPALEADLDALHGSSEWRARLRPLPATEAYVARLDHIAHTGDAARLVAHHYVRYLGDLSGGQVISRMVQRHYGVSDNAVTFFTFAGIGKLKPYKDAYRAALDNIQLDDAARAQLLDEAAVAFLMNLEVFMELGD